MGGTRISTWKKLQSCMRQRVGEPFKHTKCVPILHQLPKFDPMVPTHSCAPSSCSPPGDVSDDNDEDDNGDSDYVVKNPSSSSKKRVNNTNPVLGSGISRPIGMKKAKAIEKLKSDRTQAHAIDLTGGAAAFDEMSAATKELVAAIKVNTSLKREYLDAGQQSKWMRMAELYMGCGKKGKGIGPKGAGSFLYKNVLRDEYFYLIPEEHFPLQKSTRGAHFCATGAHFT